MIITETIEINGKQFTRTYSDANRYVVRDGIEYSEAYDPTELGRTYIEGNIIEEDEAEEMNEFEEILDIILGLSLIHI